MIRLPRLVLATALAAATALSACKKESKQQAATAPAAQKDPSATDVESVIAETQNTLATVSISPMIIKAKLDGKARPATVTVTNQSGPTVQVKVVNLVGAPPAAWNVNAADCLGRSLPRLESCRIVVAPGRSTVGGAGALLIQGSRFSGSSVQLLGTPVAAAAMQPTVRPVDELAAARAALLASAADTNPWPSPPKSSGPVANPTVPLTDRYWSTPHAIFSPRRDLRRVIERGRNIMVTLQYPILATGHGQFEGHLTYPVYGELDDANPRAPQEILLPAGTRVLGSYSAGDRTASRLPLHVDQIIAPDGRTLVVKPLSSYDAEGQEGTPAAVDKRLGQQFLAQLSAELLSIAPLLATNSTTSTTTTAFATTTSQSGLAAASSQLSQSLGEITQGIVKQTFDDAPRAAVGAGTTMIIRPNEDWYIPSASDPAGLTEYLAALPKKQSTQGNH